MLYSFLMIGQSNMAGRGYLDEVSPIYNERIKMFRNGRWKTMSEPVNFDQPAAGASLAASFAAAWCEKNKEYRIGLIPCAEGGTCLSEWEPGSELYENALNQTRIAMKKSVLAGILWHQGESDSHSERYLNYRQKFCFIMDRLLSDLDVGDIPVIIGGLGDYISRGPAKADYPEYEKINRILQQICAEADHYYFVSAEGLTANPDGFHIDAKSQRIFGRRYFEAYMKNSYCN